MQVRFSPPIRLHGPAKPPFAGKPAKTFPYNKYADLMVNYSVGGIKPGELCVVSLTHQPLSKPMLELYAKLLKRGYIIGLNLRPKQIHALMTQPPARQRFMTLENELNSHYNNVLILRDGAKHHPPELNDLLKRPAKPGETLKLVVLTNGTDKLAQEIIRRIGEQGGVPYLLGGSGKAKSVLYRSAVSDEQVKFVSPEAKLYTHMHKLFQVSNPQPESASAQRLTALQKARKQLSQQAQSALSETYMNRMRRIELGPDLNGGFFRTLGISPSYGVARDAGMTIDQFGTFYRKITKLDEPDVIGFYRAMDKTVGHYAKQLQKFHTIRITRTDGKSDLTFSIRDKGASESRYVAPSTATGNALPAEIFTSPVEDSVNGKVYLDIPFYLKGKVFEGLHLTFKDGKVVDLDLDKGDKALLQRMILKRDSRDFVPGFDVLGEFAIGFNREITELLGGKVMKNTLIAEKQDLHLALGNSYVVTGGKNRSTLHEDIPARSGPGSGLKIEGLAEGMEKMMPIYVEGQFTPEFLSYKVSSPG